jgi:hypothetical protein
VEALAHYGLLLCNMLRRYASARRVLTRALELDPEHDDARLGFKFLVLLEEATRNEQEESRDGDKHQLRDGDKHHSREQGGKHDSRDTDNHQRMIQSPGVAISQDQSP